MLLIENSARLLRAVAQGSRLKLIVVAVGESWVEVEVSVKVKRIRSVLNNPDTSQHGCNHVICILAANLRPVSIDILNRCCAELYIVQQRFLFLAHTN